jgi:hypothetical protein
MIMEDATMRRIVLMALALSAVIGIRSPVPGHADGTVTLSDFDTVPNADVAHPAGILGDVWTFVVKEPGAQVRIRVDTRDDHDDGRSNLDPVAFLFDQTGATFFGAGDEEVPCTRETVCGFACPQIGPLFLPPGKYKVVIRDFNTATTTDRQCTGGAYVLSVSGPADQVKALTLVNDDKDVSFDPITREQAITHLMNQATSVEKVDSLSHMLEAPSR